MITQRRWSVLALLALVQFVIVTDTTIVNVAVPSIGGEFALGTDGIAWVLNAYLVAAGGLLLMGGRLADLLGRRRLFLAGALLFGVASVGCAVAPTAEVLIAARGLQGVGEALASPAALSIIALIFPEPEDRARALGIWGGLAGLGATVGVTVSGVLVTFVGWRAIFWVNLPFVLVAVLALPAILKETATTSAATHPRPERHRVDVGGAVTLTAGMIAVVHGLIAAQRGGLFNPAAWVPLVGGIILLAACAIIETRHPHPLVPLRFFANRTRVVANGLSVLVVGPMASMFLLLTLYQQQTLRRTALQTGLSYVPFCILFVAAVFGSVLLMSRIGLTATSTTAFVVGCLGMLLLMRVGGSGGFLGEVLPATLVLAIGFGLAMPPLQSAAMHGLSDRDAGLGAGVQTAVQSLGNAVGVALALLVSVQVTHRLAAAGDSVAAGWGIRASFGASAVALALGAALTLLFLRTPSHDGEQADDQDHQVTSSSAGPDAVTR